MSEDDAEATGREDDPSAGSRIAGDLSAFTSLTTDFYRGEIDRATTWRARLDQTTNWAVVVVAAVLTWAFSGQNRPHYVVLIGLFAITGFLLMEANRYREYDVWRDRVRTLQADLFAEVFSPGATRDDEWRDELSTELRDPSFDISFREALTHRLRRSYLALVSILVVAWIARVTVYEPQEPWHQTAAILVIPGEIVTISVAVFYAVVVAVTVLSAREKRVMEFEE